MARIRMFIMCLALTAATCLGSMAEAGQKIVLRVGDVNADGHVIVEALKYFGKRVAELSNNTMQVDVYPAGQLGDDYRSYELLQMGGLDFYRGNASSLGDYGDIQIAATALPYIFRDRDHFWKACLSDAGQGILKNIQEGGTQMVGIAFMDEGMRNFFTVKAPVTKLADLKGLKIRVQNSKMMLSTVAALGANPTPVDYNELYSALQTGVVDGAENPPASYLANLFYEPAPHYVLDGHTYSPSILLMSEISWNRLTPEQRDIVKKAADDMQKWNREAIEKADQEAYAALRAKGVTITEVSDKDAWVKAMEPVYKEFGSQFMDLIKTLQAIK